MTTSLGMWVPLECQVRMRCIASRSNRAGDPLACEGSSTGQSMWLCWLYTLALEY